MGLCGRLIAAFVLLIPLSACILSPGKFTSTLDIGRDRSFAFTYVGEVIAPPPSSMRGETTGDTAKDAAAGPRPETPADRTKMLALADALSKEYGYRSVKYLGNYHFAVDYAVSGRLTHNFTFPFNMDGEVIIPFVAIELRGKDRVRVKAPGYANDQGQSAIPGMDAMASPAKDKPSELDGSFTLTTSADIISQNQESGATSLPDGRKRVVWRATPQTKDAPTASLRIDALP